MLCMYVCMYVCMLLPFGGERVAGQDSTFIHLFQPSESKARLGSIASTNSEVPVHARGIRHDNPVGHNMKLVTARLSSWQVHKLNYFSKPAPAIIEVHFVAYSLATKTDERTSSTCRYERSVDLQSWIQAAKHAPRLPRANSQFPPAGSARPLPSRRALFRPGSD